MSRGTKRQQDERALTILEMRLTMNTREIGDELGVGAKGIANLCRDVAKEDRNHPDPSADQQDYREAYPWAFRK